MIIDLEMLLGNGSWCQSLCFTDGRVAERVIFPKSLSKVMIKLEIDTKFPSVSRALLPLNRKICTKGW